MILIDNQYFPVVNLFKYLYKKTNVILISCESYKKMTFCNRFIIAGSNGLINLSVPLVNGRNHQMLFKDVRISYGENWQIRHWRTITSCYNKSPYFEFYRDSLEPLFRNRQDFLFDYNISVLYWLKQVLQFPAEIVIAEDVSDFMLGNEFEDIRYKWLPLNFQQSGPGIYYPQVFQERIGFQSNLSVLDMLFNIGAQTAGVLFRKGLRGI